jgi:hypothetical protein
MSDRSSEGYLERNEMLFLATRMTISGHSRGSPLEGFTRPKLSHSITLSESANIEAGYGRGRGISGGPDEYTGQPEKSDWVVQLG